MYVPALELIRRSPTFRVTGAGRAVGALVGAATAAGGAPDAAAPAGLGAAAGAGAAGAAQASRPTASASGTSAGWTRCIVPPRAARRDGPPVDRARRDCTPGGGRRLVNRQGGFARCW